MTGVIAVHLGAGKYKREHFKKYKMLSSKACKAGIAVLKQGGNALEAAKAAIIVLENDPLTNAGFGSNLTILGDVEGDASIMDGKTLVFGGCGAVKKVKNPIELAYDICRKQSEELPLGLIPPSLLVGDGGYKYAKQVGLKVVNNKALISSRALRQFKKYKSMLDLQETMEYKVLDTVGAVCIDSKGHVASACSSGGMLLKKPGRVGQAALYASGVWADSFSPNTETSVAVCTTGTGEHLVQTQLAKEIGFDLKNNKCPTTSLYQTMTDKFLHSRYLKNVEAKLCGTLVLRVSSEGEGDLLWGHSTEAMSIGYMKTTDTKPESIISQLPSEVKVGSSVTISGTHFYIKRDKTI